MKYRIARFPAQLGFYMSQDRKNVSMIITGVVLCLFVMFIVLAAFIRPDAGTGDIADPQVKAIADSMAQMMWWMTVALITLPIMLLLIAIAAYLFITGSNPSPAKPSASLSSSATPAGPAPFLSKQSIFGGKPAAAKTADPSAPGDVLDLRYARGEITRDQYMAMKQDMKTPRL
jgi:uncharacterized membrane protein (DUF485 family)